MHEIIQVRIQQSGYHPRTVFRIAPPKQGFDEIVFEQNQGSALLDLMLRFFEQGKPFSFEIKAQVPGSQTQCTIQALSRYSG